ncbi:hypothetical protein CRG98_006839 [Punica granatum]|nr:hypothetical protein CRG98_006839 [Punica granatum]
MEDLRDPILWKERNNVCLEGVGCPEELYSANVRWAYVGWGEEAFRFKVGGSQPHGAGKRFEEEKYAIVDHVFPFYSDYEPSNLRAPSRYSRWISFCPFMGL